MSTDRFFSMLLTLVILFNAFAFPVTAEENIKVTINDMKLSFDVPPIIQDGKTLVPLRAVFEALGCDVYWLEELKWIIIVKNEMKLLMRVGNEDFYKFTGYDIELFQKVFFDKDKTIGNFEEYKFDVPPQIVNNRTLVSMQLLCEAMNVNVSRDDVNKTLILICNNNFIFNENTDKVFAHQAFVFFQELEDGNIQYKDNEKNVEHSLKYEDTTPDILVELNIISKDDFNKEAYITKLEVLEIIHKTIAYEDIEPENIGNIKEWYWGYTLEPLDYLDDYYKKLLLDLNREKNQIVTYDDLLEMKFNENITNYEALKYVTRMIGDTYSCIDSPAELGFVEKIQTYEAAVKKGLINNIDMRSADFPILRQDFYKMIHKAVFVEMNIGGFAPYRERYIDFIIEKNERLSQLKKEIIIHSKVISVEARFNDDMSVSWSLPSEYKHFVTEGFWTDIEIITSDGVRRGGMITASTYNHIDAAQLIKFIVSNHPEKLNYIRCTYYKYEPEASTRDEWFFDIDISNIAVLIMGEELKPGKYIRPKGQWPAKRITLAGEQMFKEGAYYLLTSRQNIYRKAEYNSVSYGIFKATEDSNTFVNTGGSPTFGTGAIYLDEVRIQEVIVQGNVTAGFTLYVTPKSKETFTVKELNAGL